MVQTPVGIRYSMCVMTLTSDVERDVQTCLLKTPANYGPIHHLLFQGINLHTLSSIKLHFP